MYINFWYPVALEDEITNDAPLRVKLLGLNFVAFRDTSGKAHVLSDTCVHRGGALGLGKIVDDCVQCPYHGWQFDGDGKCTRIPTQLPEQKIASRAKVDSYPVEERYGIVFAFLGDLPEGERPPIFEIPGYGTEEWRANAVKVFEIEGYYERSIENGLDAAHNEFVHPMQGGPSIGHSIAVHPIEVEESGPWGTGFMQPFDPEGAKEEDKLIGAGEGSTIAGSEHHGPNTLVTKIWFSPTRKFHQIFFEAPIGARHTRIFFVNMRNWMMEPEKDQMLMDVNMKIAHEDITVVESLEPARTPDSRTREMLTPADAPIIAYRDCLKGWEEKGWKIDQQKIIDMSDDAAYAIPSPERREQKGWVLESVPTV